MFVVHLKYRKPTLILILFNTNLWFTLPLSTNLNNNFLTAENKWFELHVRNVWIQSTEHCPLRVTFHILTIGKTNLWQRVWSTCVYYFVSMKNIILVLLFVTFFTQSSVWILTVLTEDIIWCTIKELFVMLKLSFCQSVQRTSNALREMHSIYVETECFSFYKIYRNVYIKYI